MPDKLRQAVEDVKKSADRRDDEIEQAADKAQPYVHEARQRLAEASPKDGRDRH